MGIFDKARAKLEELYGRAEELYGESHGDAAAEVRGSAHQIEAESEEGHDATAAAEAEELGHGPASQRLTGEDESTPR